MSPARVRSNRHEDRSAEHAFRFTAAALLVSFVVAFGAGLAAGTVPAGLRRALGSQLVLWPQDWSFFTKLDHDVLVAYRIEPGQRGAPVLDPSRVRDGWAGGFGRARDEHVSELRQVAFRVPERYWQACGTLRGGACEQAVDGGLSYRLDSPSRHPKLCGTVVIAAERVPRPGSGSLPGSRVVHRLAIVDVRCTG